MPRFLHTADWQIGRQYGRFAPEDATVLAEARYAAVERIAALAARESIDAVLVAGDVFDAQAVSDRTIRRLFNALQGYQGPWILIPGNHDAALAESVWTRAQRLGAVPPHAHLLLEPGVRTFPDLGFAVLAAPLTQRQTHDDLTAWFDAAETPGNLARIGLAHGSVQGLLAEDIDSPNPIAADRAARARLDYLALGDWHGFKQIDERTVYSGTPEPERFRDNASGRVVRVDVPGPGRVPAVEPLEIGQYCWLAWDERLSVASDLDQLIGRLDCLPPETVLDLTLSGAIDLAGDRRLDQALSVVQGRCRSLGIHRAGLRLEPTDEDIAALRADGYVGEVLVQLRQRQGADNEDAETARAALAILAGLLGDLAAGDAP
ncbi:MAG: DNA repair exonuclease [Castellaniella sp.]|uniref:metallophosphoesterase family protein n=1 Tax=Castellaniella sp. TaxID=1955812 RepID=UPI002A365039|nr:DNA repair exonuclease [Castellaniella sp.]MDY0308406.1 DNA repair exonuclease [Castellaniella sp.]